MASRPRAWGWCCGLVLYLWGQRFLAPDSLTRRRRRRILRRLPITRQQWKAIFGLIVLCILNIVFWMVYEQGGNTLQLFADRNADWHVLRLGSAIHLVSGAQSDVHLHADAAAEHAVGMAGADAERSRPA